MKNVLIIFCFLILTFIIVFPSKYFKSNFDKKDIRISHILIEDEKLANEIKQKLDDGADFDDMVSKYSVDDSKYNKGDLGYSPKGILDEKVESTIFNMKENEITPPIKSKFGWHIIKVIHIRYFSQMDNFHYKKYRYLDEN